MRCGSLFGERRTPARWTCHCQDCRRTSGSAFTFFGVWPRPAYQGVGAFEGRSFCPECGFRVASVREKERQDQGATQDGCDPQASAQGRPAGEGTRPAAKKATGPKTKRK
ncbi:GFA family protein [Mesorhizobium sp. 113-1-2]|uniref:GFA family protein n=1 Tax=Mesorhizobium sp. 113-1-2 TaxID=2744515 RepID=UPI001FD13193|nr:GFA family protein [Mesorhizobium sp. 113-1-2]